MDIWIAEALVDCVSIPQAVETLRSKATVSFRRIIAKKPEDKNTTIIGIGWHSVASAEPLRPTICVISNFHDEQLNELPLPLDKFTARISVFQDSAPREFLVVGIGYLRSSNALTRIVHNLNRNVAGAIKGREELSPQPILKFLIDAMRDIAGSSELAEKRISRDLLAMTLPKRAVESSFLPMSDGSLAVFSLFSKPDLSHRTFTYIPDGEADWIGFGPTFVCGGNILYGFVAETLEEVKSRTVSARFHKLKPGARAGGVILDDGRPGQFIRP